MRLSKASISLRGTYGQAMAVTAPLGSVVSTSTAAIVYAGYSVVFTTLLALVAIVINDKTKAIYKKDLLSLIAVDIGNFVT